MKVSTKILIAVLALTIVPLIIINILITTIGNANIREENFEFTESLAKKTGEQIERYLDGLENYIEGISCSEAYKTAARESAESEDSDGKYSEAAERELKGQLATLGNIKAAAVYDARGNVIAEFNGKDSVAEVIDTAVLKSAAADGANVSIVQTPTKLKKDVLLAAAPIVYSGETVGFLAIESELDDIDKILADTRVGKNGYAYMIADQDRVVAHKDPSRRIALSIFKRENGLASTMEEIFKENEGVKSAVTGRLNYNYSATTVLNGAYYKFLNRDLYLMVVRPADEVVSPISSITGGLNIAMLVIALLAVITAFVMWRSSQKACDGILSGIEGVKGGRYDLPFNEKTKDEFADIAHEMNELQSRLGTIVDGLTESEKRYKIALDTVSDIVWEYDVRVKKYTFMAKDKAFLGARRIDNTRIDNMPWITPIKHEVYEQMLRDIENFASGKTNAFTFEYETKDIRGNNVWAGSVGTVVKNKEGQINKVIGSITDITQKKLYDLKVLYLAEFDKLTNVYNRGTIERKVTELLNQGGEAVKESALFMIDLDNFKNINDTFGHQFGDQILQFVSASIKSVVGEDDLVGRLGGDEFVAFVKCYDDEEQLRDISSRIVKALKSGYEKDGTTHVLSASVGVSKYCENSSDTYKGMLENADFAMYKAKMTGKNNYCIFNDDLLREKEIIDVVSAQIRNLDEKEVIDISFAPIRCGEINKITSFYVTQTACIKDHPEITIDQLYSIAEKCSRQGELFEHCLRMFCKKMKIMENDNVKNIPLKFQVPCIALPKNSMRAIITRVVTEEQVKAEQLGFCIDPGYFKEFDQSAFEFVQSLREIAMDIELCEFGDACANFAAVRDFHFDSIRFANSLLDKARESKKYMSILKMMIGVGREIDINSIIVIGEDERKRFNDALDYCYTYCTGENIQLSECEKLLRGEEVINRYTCPNFKHDLIDGVISEL